MFDSIPRNPTGRIAVPIAVLTLCAGCASFGLLAPDVTLVNLEFTDLTLFETSGVFTVRLANENPEPLLVDGGVYNLYLGGLKIGKGLSDQRIEVPGLGTATAEVQLHMNNLAVATQLRSIWESGILDYRLKARIYVEHGYGRKTLRIENEGTFDLEAQRGSGATEAAPPRDG